MMSALFSKCVLLLVVFATATADASSNQPRTNVVLLGATGNLAKKYLFQAFHDQAKTNDNLHVYPAATKAAHVGQTIVDATVKGNITCTDDASCVDFQVWLVAWLAGCLVAWLLGCLVA